MRYETRTFEIKFKVFEVGEKVRPTSPRCPLEPGEYIVTRCVLPLCASDDNSVVFVEGHKYGVSEEYLTAVKEN